MFSLGAHPWADFKITGNNINIPEADKWNLLRWGGGVPYLAYVWWGQPGEADWKRESWAWLARAGYRQPVLRLWYPGDDKNPQPLPEYKSCVDGLYDRLQEALAAYDPQTGINLTMEPLCLQFDNEPNLEHRVMGIAGYEARMKDAVRYLRDRFPTHKIGCPPLAGGANGEGLEPYDAWVEMIVRNADLFDYICIHHYLDQFVGDRQPGFKGSPEWWRKVIPNKQILVTETGSFSAQDNFGIEMRRWLSYDYVEGVFPFILSHPSGWSKWVYNEATGNLIAQMIREYRQTRRFPKGSTIVVPPTTGSSIDVTGVLADLDVMWGYAGAVDEAYKTALSIAAMLGESGNSFRERIIGVKTKVTS